MLAIWLKARIRDHQGIQSRALGLRHQSRSHIASQRTFVPDATSPQLQAQEQHQYPRGAHGAGVQVSAHAMYSSCHSTLNVLVEVLAHNTARLPTRRPSIQS